jgi:oxalate---CoA ligase
LIRKWIEQAAARDGGAGYLEDARGSGTLTYAGLLAAAGDWERRLDDAGLPPGTRIAIRLSRPLEYATALVAIIGAGRVAVPLDPMAPGADVARVLAMARPAATVADGSFGIHSLDFPSGGPAGGGIFLCTSGTTGTPKGILLRDEQLAHVAASVVSQHRLSRADRGYCPLPLFHVNAEVVGLLATLRAGACLALDRRFRRHGFWEMIAERRITWINAVPAIISILAMDPPPTRPAVRFVRSASAPLPLAALMRFESALGIPVIETYGMTEAASMITANPLDGPRKPGSAGRPAGAEVQVAGPAGPAAPGEVGRVRIRGNGVITEYASGGRPGAIDAEGWLDTGDLGYLDSDGYLFLVGRADDVINRGGEKIYPREIEEILLAQPGVRSAAVVGVADEVLGERPVAYVVPDAGWLSGAAEVEQALRDVCASELPRHKQPSAFCVVGELPLGPTGKISRRRLKDLVTVRS